VLSNRWSECDEELRAHATTCDVCREAVTIAGLLGEDEKETRRDVHVPAAGQIWWRSAIRARVEAIHAAERPMTWLHGLAGAVAVGLLLSVMGLAWPYIASVAASVSATSWSLSLPAAATASVERILPFALAALALVILTPIAIYFATNDK
jgi:hypothetical protein